MSARQKWTSLVACVLGFAIVGAAESGAPRDASMWPVGEGHVVAGFGKHRGIDIAAEAGTPVHAFRAGVVVSVGTVKGCGVRVQVRHGDLLATYCNLDRIAVTEGQQIAAGAELARIATAAPGGKPHLHFEVQADGKHVDPMTLLPKAASAG
jgi:murein DD-endopeptidase MepM/ murein hydrolase activator NlpD